MLRHPREVVVSALQWYGDWQNESSRAASWLNVSLHVEHATRGKPRAFLRYNGLLEDWRREISRTGELLELPALTRLDGPAGEAIDGFVDPKLRRSTPEADGLVLPQELEAQLDSTWRLVSRLAEPGGDRDGATHEALDDARAAYVDLYGRAEAIAQSSITAVKPRRGSQGKKAAVRNKGSNGASGSLGWSPADLLPRRKSSPARLSTSRRLVGRSLVTLPIRLALLVPVRYRERVPIPIVRAVARLSRSIQR
jgi:hypothetical protein